MASGSCDKTLKIWDVETGACLWTLEGHTRIVDCIAMLPNDRLVSGSSDKTIKVWNIETGQCLKTLEGHTAYVLAIKQLFDGRLISCSLDCTIKIWNIDSGSCDVTLKCGQYVGCLAELSDGRLVAGIGESGLIRVWNISDLQCVLEKKIHTNGVTGLIALLNGSVISASWDRTLKLWNPTTGDIIRTFAGHTNSVEC